MKAMASAIRNPPVHRNGAELGELSVLIKPGGASRQGGKWWAPSNHNSPVEHHKLLESYCYDESRRPADL